MRSIDRWRALTRQEQRLTVKSAAIVAAAVASLRLLGVKRCLHLASPSPRRRHHGGAVQPSAKNVIDNLAAATERAGRYVPGATCLSKSVALAWMLRREGVDAAIRIGVTTAGGFDAHAWVEANGLELIGAAGFAPLGDRRV